MPKQYLASNYPLQFSAAYTSMPLIMWRRLYSQSYLGSRPLVIIGNAGEQMMNGKPIKENSTDISPGEKNLGG